jgi:L-threonylcarbamoyladenylate synthase
VRPVEGNGRRAVRAARRWRFGDDLGPLRDLLARGGVLAVPTESSYGLAADPRSAAGVEAIYRIKSRERGKPLPVVAADLAQIASLGIDVDEEACRLAAGVWPAPLSVLLPIASPLPAAAGEPALAVRIPDHALLRDLLRDLGTPLTATSANLSGEPPLLAPDAVAGLLADHDALVVDGGVLAGGPPSTLAAWTGSEWRVLREGRFSKMRLPVPRF